MVLANSSGGCGGFFHEQNNTWISCFRFRLTTFPTVVADSLLVSYMICGLNLIWSKGFQKPIKKNFLEKEE